MRISGWSSYVCSSDLAVMISPFTIAVALRTLGSVGPNMVSLGGRLKSPSGADWAPIGNGVAARIIEVKSQGATRIGQILQKKLNRGLTPSLRADNHRGDPIREPPIQIGRAPGREKGSED